MFYGEYEHTIDRKGRLIVPAKFRQVLEERSETSLFVTQGLDTCLFLFPESEWRQIESRFKDMPFTKGEVRKFSRQFFGKAAEVHVDSLGRLLLPRMLRDLAGITGPVVLLGVSNRIEVWAKATWQSFDESSRSSFEEVAERIMLE